MFINALTVRVSLAFVIAACASTAEAANASVAPKRTSETLSTVTNVSAVPLAISLSSTSVVGGSQITATITLSTAAASRVEITLRSSNDGVARFGGAFAAIGSSQLTIPPGSQSATFPVRTFAVSAPTTVTLQAISGSNSGTTELTVVPPSISAFVISPSKVVGGLPVTGTITLDGPAPSNPTLSVHISRRPEAALLPPITFTAGSTSTTFTIGTSPIASNTDVTMSATLIGSDVIVGGTTSSLQDGSVRSGSNGTTARFTILAPVPTTLLLNPTSIPGGSVAQGTILLTGRAPASGINVNLSSSRREVFVPSTINISAGTDRQTFQINTLAALSSFSVVIAAISGAQGGTSISDGTSNTIGLGENPQSLTATLSITPTPPPLTITSITFAPPTVVGGASTTGTIRLSGPASSAGASVRVQFGTAPIESQLVTVSPGATSSTFSVRTGPVSTDTIVKVSATTGLSEETQNSGGVIANFADGSVRTVSPSLGSFTVLAPVLRSLLLQPPSVVGGNPTLGTVVLTGLSPANGLTVGVASGGQDATVPTSVTIPAGRDRQDFTIATQPVATSRSVAITAFKQLSAPGIADGTSNTILPGESGSAVTANLSLTPPPLPIESFTLRPTTVHSGHNVIAQLRLASTAPATLTVNLTTDHPELITIPATVTVARSTIAPFTFPTSTVSAETTVTVTASSGTQTISVTVTLVP